MMLLIMKTYPALLWGFFLLLSVEAASVSIITESSNITSPVAPSLTTTQPTREYVRQNETNELLNHKPAQITATPQITQVVIKKELLYTPADTVAMKTAANDHAHNVSTTEMAKPTEDESPQKSTTRRMSPTTAITSPKAATMSLTTAMPPESSVTSLTTSPTEHNVTAEFLSTVTPKNYSELPHMFQNLSTTSVSLTSQTKANHTFGSSPKTSVLPEQTTEIPTTPTPSSTITTPSSTTTTPSSTTTTPSSTTSTLSPTSAPASATTPNISTSAFPTKLNPTTESPSTNVSFSTTSASNTSGGILIPVRPKKLPLTTCQTPAPASPVTNSPPTSPTETCLVRGIVRQSLIAIATLAVLATIFMVSTIVLCTKLSARKYRAKNPQQETEMMCISELLPERNYNYRRQRSPVRNGVLVMLNGDGSESDGEDNLTLSSFLPDNDRFV